MAGFFFESRKQMNSAKDSSNVKKNSGAVQKSRKHLSLLFLRELFQVIHCSQRKTANHALYLANPKVSQLLSACNNQKERWPDGGIAPPRVSVHHNPKWGCWGSTLGPNFQVTPSHSTVSLYEWGVMGWFGIWGGLVLVLFFKKWVNSGFCYVSSKASDVRICPSEDFV